MTTTIEGHSTVRVESDPQVERRAQEFLTILCTDSLAVTAPIRSEDADYAVDSANQVSELAAGIIQKHHGQVLKTIRGSLVAEFGSPALAVRAAMEMERSLAQSSHGLSRDFRPGLRIGVHGFTSQRQAIDAFSDLIHGASNLTKQAAPGQILVSRDVCDALSAEADLGCQWLRSATVDGQVNEDIFEVHWAAAPANLPSRYEVLAHIGTGGMGMVYKVRDRETDDVMALKILKAGIASDPAMQENLRREVCLARKVTHKNVCRIHEFNRSSDTACISMEYIEGESLLSRLHRNGPVSWNEATSIARQICAGLREAHLQGIVHRDLKPANIMVDTAGVVKIMDFGIARLFQSAGQMTGTLVGTPAYMAPEQVELKPADARTDVYALGLLLYEIITGTVAFEGDTPIAVAVKQLREFPKRPRELAPALSGHAEAVILKCLQKDPAKRFQSVDDLAAALRSKVAARPAMSMWQSFLSDTGRAAREFHRSVEPWIAVTADFLRRQNWRALTAKPSRRALAAGLGAACLLSLLVVSIRSSGKIPANRSVRPAALVSTATPIAQPVAPSASAASATPMIATYQVDISAGSTSSADDSVPLASVSPTPSPALAKALRAGRTAMQPVARVTVASSTARKAVTTSLPKQDDSTPQSAPAEPGAVTSDAAANDAKDDKSSDLSAAVEPTVPPAASEERVSNQETGDAGHLPPGRYFEVGSFKDSTWADQAVQKLTQLGFHAVSVHKSVLWMQSYQVRVGPYQDSKDSDTARQDLMAQGFKPHPVK